MFEQLEDFQQAFEQKAVEPSIAGRVGGLRKRMPTRKLLSFWLTNLCVLPPIFVIYTTIISDGIRKMMPAMGMKLSRLAFPGAGLAASYDGLNRVELAHGASALLFVVVTWLYIRIWDELQGYGPLRHQTKANPVLLYVLGTIAAVVIAADAWLFWAGMSTSANSGWADTPDLVAPVATVLYSCGLAIIGWWHSEHRNYGRI
jgi:hypothetical protein